MSCHLPGLPVELINSIAAGIAEEDILRLRQTCRELSYKCEDVFGTTFFKKRCHLYTGRGLKALAAISARPQLASKIETIVLCPIEVMAAWKCGDPDYRSEEDHPRCDPRTRSGRLKHKTPDPEAVETAVTDDCTRRFKMQLQIERDRQDDVRLLTNVFANLAPYRRASTLALDSPSWSRGQLLDLVQYMGKLNEGPQLSTIISHLRLNLPSDHFAATLDAMQSSLNCAYSDMWQSPDPLRYISSICAAMSGSDTSFRSFEMPAFASEMSGRTWSMASLPSWGFFESPRAVARLCCAWGSLTSLHLPYTMPHELKTCLTKPLAAAVALKKLTYSHMFSYEYCALQPPKEVLLEHIILEDPYPPGNYDLTPELLQCMMRTKRVTMQIRDYDLGCLWYQELEANKISAVQDSSTVEWFEWTIPHIPDEDESGPWEVSGSAKGERAFTEGWNDMLLHLREP